MRRCWQLVVTAALFTSACESVPPSGDPLAPVRVQEAAPRVVVPVGENPVREGAVGEGVAQQPRSDAFDFEGEDRSERDEVRGEEMDPVELQARFFGVDPAAVGHVRQQQAQPAEAQQPQPPAMPQIGEWDPAQPLPDGSFGIRLLATLTDVQPPRAIIGLPDGTEQVVQPGAFLEKHRLVVMAIGRDVVQIARIVPDGYYARIDTQNVQALFPAARRESMQ